MGVDGSLGVFVIFIGSIHCAGSMVFCVGFSDWSRVWGGVKLSRSGGIVSSRSFASMRSCEVY